MDLFDLSFAKKKILQNRVKFFAVLGLVLIVFILDIIFLVTNAATVSRRLYTMWTMRLFIFLPIMILAASVSWWVINIILKRVDRKMDEYATKAEYALKGDDGEEMVDEELKANFLGDCKIFRNCRLPGRRSDLDFIVVSLKGVCVLEVKNLDTYTIFTHDAAYFKNKTGNPVPLQQDVREIVKWQSVELKKYLLDQGIDDISVRKVVVYVNPDSVEIRDNGKNRYGVYVAVGLGGLEDFIASSYIDQKFNPEFRLKVCEALSRL